MSELPHVHAPQQGVHTWRDFLVHIAVITIGLLLAIGLQQIVEAVHDRNERAHVEEQMHETFVATAELALDNANKLERLQSYLRDLRLAVDARIEGRSAPAAPSETDPRNFTYFPPPGLGAYEASKANGTVALLSFDTIRLYDRMATGIDLVDADLQRYISALIAWRSFAARYGSPLGVRNRLPQADLSRLSAEELIEYRVLIGNLLGIADGFETRMRNIELACRTVLDGAQTEDELRAAAAKLEGASSPLEAVGGQ